MPELPDLEIFARNLNNRFKNKTLMEINVKTAKKLNISIAELKTTLEGQELNAVVREGKTLNLKFKNKEILGLHLMLHGEIKLLDPEEELRFVILELLFKDGDGFAMTDFQKQATPTLNPERSTVPDALSEEMNLEYLTHLLSTKKAKVKQVLLDQHVIRGIGNAYADEILWKARISPFSVAKAIPKKNIMVLLKAIKEVLHTAVEQINMAKPGLLSGEVRDFMAVHHPKKEKSPTGALIKVEKKGARKSYYTDEQELFE